MPFNLKEFPYYNGYIIITYISGSLLENIKINKSVTNAI